MVITKPNKETAVVILDPKLYDNPIQEIIWNNAKFENLKEDPTLKREASIQRFLHKLKQKNFFKEIESDKLHRFGPSLLVSMVVLKCTNSPLVF